MESAKKVSLLGILVQATFVCLVAATYGQEDIGLDQLLDDPRLLSSLMLPESFPRDSEADAEEAATDPLLIQPRDGLQSRVQDLLDHESPISIRDQEFLEHSSLPGHLFMQGGAGEGHQHLKPDGSVANMQVVKTDAILPAYCNPPNPCPPGYTAADDCLEDFENTAAFSRDFQAKQQCMCDQEHMFDCPGATEEAEMDTLARSISNSEFSETFDKIANSLSREQGASDKEPEEMGDHRVVAKKFFSKKQADKTTGETVSPAMRVRYTMREKKGSSHSPLPWFDDVVAAAAAAGVPDDGSALYSFV